MSESIKRFSNRVANYVKYRPDYPREIVPYLAEQCGLTSETVIADIGCGTGISTRLFLENGNCVYGVEPNDAMRLAGIEFLAEFPRFIPAAGTSENTTLADGSVEMIVAAQAFHWFDLAQTKEEFKRIIQPGGYVVLIWNERKLDATQFHVEYEAFLVKYSTDYEIVRHDRFDETILSEFSENGVEKRTFNNFQLFDFDGIKGRALSASYMPSEADESYGSMVNELKSIFAKHAENGKIKVFYDTNVYSSRM